MADSQLNVRRCRLLVATLTALAVLGSAGVAAAASVTFAPSDDATLRVTRPTTNYGARTSLEADASSRKDALLRFDVSGVGSSGVTSAVLRLYNIDSSSTGGTFTEVSDSGWSEDVVTWANSPPGDGVVLGSLGRVSSGNPYEVDVTALVTGDGPVRIRISSSSSNGADYASKEHNNAAWRPTLVVTVDSGANIPPSAQDDATPVPGTGSSSIDVLANDSDPDGSLVPSSVTIVQAVSGSVTREPTSGAVIYTPAQGFLGDDSFTYTVADDLGLTSNTATVTVRVLPTPVPGETVVVAAGDIACEPGAPTTPTRCRHAQTAQLAEALSPSAVLALGDLQYNSGKLADFLASYDPTWGALKSVTFRTVGNHEYGTSNAGGYFSYFGAQAGDPAIGGYYSFDQGGWHFVALNTNCTRVPGGCGPGSPQAAWLEADLAQHNGVSCTIAFGHHPRWASGSLQGDNPELQPLWSLLAEAGVDVYLAGHNHNMQRYEPLDANGAPDPNGIREFIIGTGGRDISGLTSAELEPEVEGFANTFGVLRLSLGAGTYAWSFISQPGDPQADAGSAACTDGATNSPPIAIDDAAATPLGTPVSIDVLANDSDPDGDSLAVTDVDTTGTQGTVTDTGNGTYTYVPAAGFAGEDSFAYTATDPDGLTDTAVVTVTVAATTTLILTPTDDATIRSGSRSNRNYGTAVDLLVDRSSEKDFVLRFDVSGVSAASVVSATLRLHNINKSPFGGEFLIVTDTAWDEETVTWDNAPAGDGGSLGSLNSVSPGNWYLFDATALVNGDGTVSVRVTSPNSDGADYASKEHPSGFAPELVIQLS